MEYLPGVCAGISQTIVGHPIDTAKVLVQNKMRWHGLPIKDYYRGFRLPMVTSIVFNSIVQTDNVAVPHSFSPQGTRREIFVYSYKSPGANSEMQYCWDVE